MKKEALSFPAMLLIFVAVIIFAAILIITVPIIKQKITERNNLNTEDEVEKSQTETNGGTDNTDFGNWAANSDRTNIPSCTESDWQFSLSPTTCPSSRKQTKSWSKIGRCVGGVNHNASEIISCSQNTIICTNFTYGSWNDCTSSGTQSRNISSSLPNNCQNGIPILSQSCNYIPLCTENDWSSSISPITCPSSEQQTKAWTKTGTCSGGVSHSPSEAITCDYSLPTCTSFTYTNWGVCTQSGTQARSVLTSSPLGCQGGNSILSQTCNYIPSGLDFNIILIGWDGLQRNHFFDCYNQRFENKCPNGLPNIKELSGDKIYRSTVTNGDTGTKSGWIQILTGYDAEVTRVYSNSDYNPIPEGYTIFEKLENHFGGENIETIFLGGKYGNVGGLCKGDQNEIRGQPYCISKDNIDYYENGITENEYVGQKALAFLESHSNDKFFAFFHFWDPDSTGHSQGENSNEYTDKILDDDYWLGRIMTKLKDKGIYDDTIIYVVSDHGFDEGGNAHKNAPYVIFASNDDLVIRGGNRKDIAPTILKRYGLSLGKQGDIPAIDGYPLDTMPTSCVPEGESYVDYAGEPPGCCSGLELISLDRLRIDGDECYPPTGAENDDSGHCTKCGDGICLNPEDECNCPSDCLLRQYNFADFGEFGLSNITHQWSRINFKNSHTNPVVIAKPLSNKGWMPVHAKIKDVDSTGFSIRVDEWDYRREVTASEKVNYLVMESGQYEINGNKIEVGKVNAQKYYDSSVTFSQTIDPKPIIFAQVQTYNGGESVVTRINKVTKTGFDVRMQEQEKFMQETSTNYGHVQETVGWIAIQPGTGTYGNMKYELGRTTINNNWKTIDFNQQFENHVFLADIQSINEEDTATLKYKYLMYNFLEVKIQEERSEDDELIHVNEDVGYAVLGYTT